MSLPTPKGRQVHVVHLPAAGHQVVLGTAGTGKTTMAMLRAEHLAAPQTRNNGPALLVTYNNTLVTYLRFLQPAAAHRITIETYGKFARGYLHGHGLMPNWGGIARPGQRRTMVAAAVSELALAHPNSRVLRRDTAFFLDELEWIAGMGIATLDDYKTARRYGRETALNEQQRERVWAVLSAYQRQRAAAGIPYDWYDIASSVRHTLATDTSPRRYKHIVVDEGQDLSPEAVRSLAAAVDPGGSLTFFGDYHQAIYGQGLSWRACGLDLRGRPVERFEDNYRNTGEIARLAIAMAHSPFMAGDVEDLVEPRQPRAAGAPPTLVKCRDRRHEIEVVRAQALDLARDRTVAILARTWADAERACAGLSVRKLHADMYQWDASPGIYCGAYHSAKGLEFDAVILPFVSEQRMPLPEVVAAFGEDEANAREARLLYVASTRARTDLLLTYSGALTPLLPSEAGLYIEVAG